MAITISAHRIINEYAALNCAQRLFEIATGKVEETEEFKNELASYLAYDASLEVGDFDSPIVGDSMYHGFTKYFVEQINEYLHSEEYSHLSYQEMVNCLRIILESATQNLPYQTELNYTEYIDALLYSGRYGLIA